MRQTRKTLLRSLILERAARIERREKTESNSKEWWYYDGAKAVIDVILLYEGVISDEEWIKRLKE